MNNIDKLIEYFREFPGIGPRQAKRFVYFILSRNQTYLNDFKKAIDNVKESVRICQNCFRFFSLNGLNRTVDSKENICSICKDPNRDTSLLMILAKNSDLEAVEKSNSWNGLYFVIGSNLPILEKDPERKIRIRELKDKVLKNTNIKEVVLSFSTNTEGENTADYVKSELTELSQKNGFKISSLGRGLSTGSELEYSDSETLKGALKNRS